MLKSTPLSPDSPAFACDKGGPPFVCRFGGAGTGLGPRESRTVPLRINLNLPAGTTSLKNCAVKSAPQKKAELQIPLNRSLPLTNASFRPQSLAKGNGFLHLAGILDDVGGEVREGAGGGVGDAVKGVIGGAAAPAPAGGNIGGVSGVAQNCTRWGLKQNRLALRQSNGLLTYFFDIEVDQYSKIVGTARYYSISADGTKGPLIVGRVTSFGTDKKPAFRAYWPKSGEHGDYFFDIGSDGKAKGTYVNQAGVRGTFVDEANQWVCKSSPFCEAYADKAVQAFVAARKDGCSLADLGVPAGAGGRWTANRQEHIDFCMARASTVDPAIEAENKARTDGHAACLVAKKNREACATFAKDVVAINEQMKAISCKDALPNLTVEGGTSICLLKTGPDAAVKQEMQRRLDVCKAQLAANGNAGAGGGDAGGGGQAQEPAPEQCAVVTIEDVKPPGPVVEPPGPAPEQPKNLALAHNPAVAQCSDTGGGCAFTTSISNPADAPEFNGPISFVVHLSQPDGSVFPNVTMESGGQAPNVAGVTAPISCKKDGNDVTCTAAAAKVPPGKSVPVPMSFKPGGGTMATAIKSCASLAGGEMTCASIPLVKGPLLRVAKQTAAQTCVPFCHFNIFLTNVGNADAPGPFVIKDVFKPPNADTAIERTGGSFDCSKSADGAFSCTINKDVLKPGETVVAQAIVKTATVSPTYTNCIDYSPAANVKPSPFDGEFAGRCVTIKDTAHQGANLMVEVIPPNGKPDGIGECSIDSACKFTVKTTSNGSENVPAGSIFDAKVENGTAQSVAAMPGGPGKGLCGTKAADSQMVSCTSGVELPPQTSQQAEVTVIAGTTWKKNDTLTLCAQTPPGDSNPNDDKACASVKLDPFSVKVAKSGDQSCTQGGDCHFTLRLFNPGPIDHNAPVTISDKLTGLASARIVSITPPLPCATQPTQIPFSCTSPGPVRLDLDAPEGSEFGPRDFKMVVRLPSDASATQFSNCADVSGGATGANEQSCKTVSLTPPVQACLSGMVLSNGICVCPAGTRWNGRSCAGQRTGGASASKPITPDVAPVLSTAPAACKFGMILAGNGLCACPANTRWTGKACEGGKGGGGFDMIKQATPAQLTTCPAEKPVGAFPNCCPKGTKFRFGKCTPLCAGALVMDENTGRCVSRCKRGTHIEGDVCVADKKKKLETNTLPRVCPPDRPVGAYPNCCPQGTDFRNGKCRFTKAAPVKCRKSQMFDPVTGVCIDRARRRFCPADRPVGAYPDCCPEGYQFANGKCRRFREQRQERQYCPPDRPVGIYPNCCPEGYQFTGRRCRLVRERQEEQACPASRPVGVYPNCCPEGYQFTGRRCRKLRDPDQQQPDQGTRPNKPNQKVCADGTVVYGRYSQCPNDKVAPRPQPQPQPQQQCRGDKISTPNGCMCPQGTREDPDGQCIDRVN